MSTTASNSNSRVRQFFLMKIKSFQGSNTLFQLYVEIHLKSKMKYHNTPHKVLQYKTRPNLKHSLNFHWLKQIRFPLRSPNSDSTISRQGTHDQCQLIKRSFIKLTKLTIQNKGTSKL